MKKYLNAIISEQINRGLSLKKLIPHPLKYPELSSLADRCGRKIDENNSYLKYLQNELEGREEGDIRDIFRGFRRCTRELELIEYYGISALYYETPEIGYLNKLIFQIHQEIKLPLTPPCVSCISTNYYYFHPFTNVIFVPIGETEFLLHLPDVFHELGHVVVENRKNELRLKELNKKYEEAIDKITKYYQNLLSKKIRETGPERIPMIIEHCHSQWKDYWIDEFFSDLFALYTLGPAYAWAHVHISTKKSEDIYDFSTVLPQKHPSDDSRMNMLILGLKLLGFEDVSRKISEKWKSLPMVANFQPSMYYRYGYPEKLISEVAKFILDGLSNSGFFIISPKKLDDLSDDSVIKLLNESWNKFWEKTEDYRKWEEKSIKKLKLGMDPKGFSK